MAQALLSELCSICHTEKPKYRCPRCQTQTCSLACSKRHKQRASCSGKRDPTTYVKKSQWTTPAGIDHDYNYLTTVERSIDGASQNVKARGIGTTAMAAKKAAARAWQPGSALQNYLTKNQITVEHAPMGMSRQKSNQTRVTRHGNVIWTVEWYDVDGVRHLQHDECLGSAMLEELYTMLQAEIRNARKREVDQRVAVENARAKRPRLEAAEASPKIHTATGKPTLTEHDQEVAPSASNQPDADTKAEDKTLDEIKVEDVETETAVPAVVEADNVKEEDAQLDDIKAEEDDPSSMQTKHQSGPHHFYLLRPSTASRSRVLIPLEPRTTLTASLQGRTVQEYPTIHVLRQPPAELPVDFLLEEEYLKPQRPTRSDSSLKREDVPEHRQGSHPTGQQIDANAILDMLKRDVTV